MFTTFETKNVETMGRKKKIPLLDTAFLCQMHSKNIFLRTKRRSAIVFNDFRV